MLNTKPIKKTYSNNFNSPDQNKYDSSKHEESGHYSKNDSSKHDKTEKTDHKENKENNENNDIVQQGASKPLFKLESNKEELEINTPDKYKNNISNILEKKEKIQYPNIINTYNVEGANLIQQVYGDKLLHKVEYNQELGMFNIYENNELDCSFNFNDLLKYILNSEEGKISIKKYIFIISVNPNLDINEFNFVNSVFTTSLDCMTKLQNFIYETIGNFESLDVEEAENYKNLLIIFYYQLIIWLFKNISVFEDSETNIKISKIYSGFVYRFSTLILKNILQIQSSCEYNQMLLDNLTNIKDDLNDQLFNMNQYLSLNCKKSNENNLTDKFNINKLNESFKNNESNKSNPINNKNKSDISLNSSTEENESLKSNSESIIKKYNIKNKNGAPISNFVDLFSDQNLAEINLSDDSDNGYKEIDDTINDTITSYKLKNKQFPKIKNIEISSGLITGTGTTATGTTATGTTGTTATGTTGTGSNLGNSYNINSAKDNAQIFKLLKL